MAAADPPVDAPPPAPARKRRHPLVKLLRVLLWFLVSIVALVLLAFMLLQTEPGRELLKDAVLGVLNNAFQGTIECKRIGGFLPFDATLEGVVIKDPEGNVALSVEKVEADFHPLELLQKHVHLSNIRVSAADWHVVDDQGRIMLARALAPRNPVPTSEPLPWVITLEGIQLDASTIVRPLAGEDFALTELTASVTLGVDAAGPTWKDGHVRGKATGTSELALAIGGEPVDVRVSGALRAGNVLVFDQLDISAGPHRARTRVTLQLADLAAGAAPSDESSLVEISGLHVDVSALPPPVRALLGDGVVDGGGRVRLQHGDVEADLALLGPLGFVSVRAGATVLPALGEYAGTVWLFDAVLPKGLAADLPPAVAASRVDASFDFRGYGDPTRRASDLVVEGDVWERVPSEGHLALLFARDHAVEGLRAPPTYTLRVDGDAFGVQPWLGVAGQPELAGQLDGLWAEGTFVVPRGHRPFDLRTIFAFEGTVEGVLHTGTQGQPLALRHVAVLGTIAWDGAAPAPVGHFEVEAAGVAVEAASARAMAATIDLELDAEHRPRGRGTLHADEFARLDVQAERLDVPFDLTLVDGFPVGDVGAVIVSGVVGPHRIDRGEAALHVVREDRGVAVRGDLKLAGLVVDHGAERIGGGRLAIDYRLATVDPFDPLGTPSRGTVSGVLTNVSAGPRSAGQLDVDLRLDADHGLAGPLHVTGTTNALRVSAPEATAARLDSRVDLVLRDGRVSGQATLDADDALVKMLPPAGGRRFDRAHVDVRTADGQRFEVAGELTEAGKLETSFQAHLQAPHGRVPVTVTVDELRARRPPIPGKRRDTHDLLVLKNFTLDATGAIDFGTLEVGRVGDVSGHGGGFAVTGHLLPHNGKLALEAHGEDIRIDDWLAYFVLLTGLPVDGLPDVDGTIAFSLSASGTLTAPHIHAVVHVADARLDQREHGALDADVTLSDDAFEGTFAARWSQDGHLEGSLRLPVDVSLSPFRVHFDETAPVALQLDATVPDVRAALAWAEAGVGHPLVPDITGGTKLTASVSGTGLLPAVSLHTSDLSLGDWRGGIALDARADPHDPHHWGIDLVVSQGGGSSPGQTPQASADASTLLRLRADFPTTVFDAWWVGEPGAVGRALAADEMGFVLKIPERTLRDLPGIALIKDFRYGAVTVRTDLRIAGRYPNLVADGLVRVTGLDELGFGGGVEARFGSTGDELLVMLDASSPNMSLVSGQITIPRFGSLLGTPERFRDLLKDPDFKVEIDTAALDTDELANLDPSLGSTLEMLFPYSVATAHVVARGQAGGPEANVMLEIFSRIAAGADVSAADQSAAVGDTSLARQTYVSIAIGRVETEVRALLFADSNVGSGVSFATRADVGTTALLDGTVGDVRQIPISAHLAARTFRLDGLAAALQGTLGGTRGFLDGDVDIEGTLGRPSFHGSQTLTLEPLAVPRIGFEQPTTLLVGFDGSSIRLQEPLVFDAGPDKNKAPQTMELDFAAQVPSFDPAEVGLTGSVTFLRYPVLNTDDMKVRASGRVTLAGTVARPVVGGSVAVVDGVVAPDIAQREVRAMGLPADVTLVRGDPRPPRDVAKRVVSKKTALQVDVTLEIPKGSVRVEPHIVQPIGEVRALLYPNGTLHVRTVQRELGVFGTIYVPKDSIYLYGKAFRVDPDSRVVFTGDMETDPQIYFTARYNIKHVDLSSIGLATSPESEVAVRVTGSPSTELRIDFASDPPMDEANILSVIALDQPAGGGEGLGDAVTQQIAGAVLGMATLELTRDLMTKLHFDVLRIDTSSSSLDQARVTVGKRVADRIFLYTYFNVNAGPTESVYEFAGEYRFNRVFSIVGKWGDIGEYSLEGTLRFQP